MPPTPTRAQRQAEATGAELDQIMTMLGGPAALKLPTYTALRRRIVAVIRRDDEPNVIDGYESRHGDTSGTGGGNSELTPVERVAFRLVEAGQPADIVHAKVTLIVANVRQTRDRVVGVDNALRLIPAEPGQAAPEAALCSCCRLEPGDRETDVDGALPGVRFLCVTCITFVERQAGATVGRNAGRARLPTTAEVEARRRGKTATKRVNPKDRPFAWRDGSTTGITPTPPTAA